jgi:hypothetical protein
MAYRDSTTNGGQDTLPTVAVPSGAAINDIAILVLSLDSAATDPTADLPSGFTELVDTSVATPDGQRFQVAWKRLSAADAGSYAYTDIGISSADWLLQCMLLSGRSTTTAPTLTTATNNSSNASPVSVNATGLTAAQGSDIVFVGMGDPDATAGAGAMSFAPPGSYTEAEDATADSGDSVLFCASTLAYRENVNAGSTGTITGTLTLSAGVSGWGAFLVEIPMEPTPFLCSNIPNLGKLRPGPFKPGLAR